MPDNKNLEENKSEESQQTSSAKLKISETNINSDGKDDSEILIEKIQKVKYNLIQEIYEIFGEKIGTNNPKIGIRNYSIETPLQINNGTGMFGELTGMNADLSNYSGGIISLDALMKIFPNAKRDYAAACLMALDKYGQSIGLTDKGKLMVLAQLAVESGRFVYTAEIGKGKGRKYGIPSGPYNKIYYGRGPIQITWESNYKKITQEIFPKMGINVDIWANPDLCEQNLLIGCAASLAWFMLPGNGKRAVQCANNGDVDGLSKAINGGWNGIEHRREYTKKIFEFVNNAR